MYCRNCGKEFAETDIFCTGCGQRKEAAPAYSGISVQLPQKSTQGRGLAIAAMVLGIISTIYSFLFIPGILGIVFGFSAKSQGNKSGMATAGIACGIVSICLGILYWALIVSIAAGLMR